jgi:hypothetical protein
MGEPGAFENGAVRMVDGDRPPFRVAENADAALGEDEVIGVGGVAYLPLYR